MAHSAPIPREAPVTKATFPVRSTAGLRAGSERKNPPSVAATFCVSVSAAGAGVASLVASVVVTVVVTPDAWALVTVVVVVGCEMGGAGNYVECKRKKVLFNG